jgi:hypothetical protein
MAYSYSGIKDFKTCGRKYYETRVLKKYPMQETQATMYGKEVHKAFEDFLREGKPLGPHERFQEIADVIARIKGDKYPEYEMALDHELNPCDFKDENAFIRGIADFVIVDDDKATVGDFKTGKATYPDIEQLELMALMVFRHFPKVTHVKAALLFVLYDKIETAEYLRADAKKTWVKWLGKIEAIEEAHQTGVWNEVKSGLCRGYCPCTECPHNQPLRR